MSTIVQQHKSDDALIPILNDIHNTITENHSKSNSSIDESFQKLEPKIFELNKFVNYKLTLSNKKKRSTVAYEAENAFRTNLYLF